MKIWIALLASCLVLSSCGWGPFKKKRKGNSTEYFIHGDPHVMIAGASKNLQSFLTPENFRSFNNFSHSSDLSFIEQEPAETYTNWDQVEADNSTEASDDTLTRYFETLPMVFEEVSPTRIVYKSQNAQYRIELGFELVDGRYVLKDRNGSAVQIEHYSLSEDGKAFSLLYSGQISSYGRYISAIYFADASVSNPLARTDGAYSFLYGDAKITWQNERKLSFCGQTTETENQTAALSIAAWNADPAPSATRKAFPYDVRSTFAPFSDLNESCIFLINTYRYENSEQVYTAGVTSLVPNLASKFVIDSDIFMFVGRAQAYAPFAQGAISPSLTHEIGHFLGLGHEFRRTESGAALYPSVMGYSRGTPEVTDWDFTALRALYGQSIQFN